MPFVGHFITADLLCTAWKALMWKTLTSCSIFYAAVSGKTGYCHMLLMVDLYGSGTKICPAGR